MSLLDLSIRHKIPLWGSVLVIVTAVMVSAVMMVDTYKELQEDLLIEAQTLASGLRANLFSALQQDNVWHGYETVSAPQKEWQTNRPDNIIVVDSAQRVFVASRPRQARMQTPLRDLGLDYAVVAERLAHSRGGGTELVRPAGSPYVFVAAPISNEGVRLGSLLIVLPKYSFMPRFYRVARDGLIAGLVLLCFLLPINWYWGRHMAQPLVLLTQRMANLGDRLPEKLDSSLYVHDDEIGSLFKTYNKMLLELRTKEDLERQVVHSDRLAALGQLAASVAHEINNPLGGMLMAIDTLKRHGVADARTTKTIALLERGLGQIRDTVGALLVEAKLGSRNLTPDDIEDVLLLVLHQSQRKGLHIAWHNNLSETVPLPATLVRQVLINLLLNAIHAAAQDGQVQCCIGTNAQRLRVAVTNDGKVLSEEQMSRLFEPFSPLSVEGHGLGLWVSYRIAQQLGGNIAFARIGECMQFSVEIPFDGSPHPEVHMAIGTESGCVQNESSKEAKT